MAEKRIGSRTFQVGLVLATDAIRLQARLLRVVGGAVDRLPDILKGHKNASAEDKAKSQMASIAALSDIFGKCDPDEVVSLIADVVAMARIQQPSKAWAQADLDSDFSDHRGDIVPLVWFVLKEVLGDFFSDALEAFNRETAVEG